MNANSSTMSAPQEPAGERSGRYLWEWQAECVQALDARKLVEAPSLKAYMMPESQQTSTFVNAQVECTPEIAALQCRRRQNQQVSWTVWCLIAAVRTLHHQCCMAACLWQLQMLLRRLWEWREVVTACLMAAVDVRLMSVGIASVGALQVMFLCVRRLQVWCRSVSGLEMRCL